MKKIRNKNKIILFILALIITVGYAYISTNLNIITNLTFETNRWNVYFNNVNETHGSEFATVHPETNGSTTKDLNFSVHLPKPGDYYEFYVDVENYSDNDVMVSLVTTSSLTDEQKEYAEVIITYDDDIPIEKYNYIKSQYYETIKTVVKYKEDITKEVLEATKEPISISLSIEYTSANQNAKERNKNYTKIIDGYDLNSKMLSLANGNPIQHFKRVYEIDNQYKTSNNIISTDDSYKEVYAWYDNGYINVYSDIENNNIYFGELSYMFYNFKDLIDISFEGFATDFVTDMSCMCQGDTSLTNFYIRNFNLNNVENAINTFKECTSLTYQDITFGKKIKDITGMFEGCTSLVQARLYGEMYNLESMESLFKDCIKLSTQSFEVTGPDGQGPFFKRLKNVESMFENCTSIEGINIAPIDFSTIENIYKMFYGCSSLHIIKVNPTVDVNLDRAKAFQTDYDIFTGCTSLGFWTNYDPNHTGSDYAKVGKHIFDETTKTWVWDDSVEGYFVFEGYD